MPLPLLLPLIGAGIQAGGLALDYFGNKPKKPQNYNGQMLQQLREAGIQQANASLANTGLALSQALAARGLSNSGAGLSVLGSTAGKLYGQANSDYLKARSAADQFNLEQKNQFEEAKRKRLSDLIGGLAQIGGSTLGNIAGVNESDAQFERYMKYLENGNNQQYSYNPFGYLNSLNEGFR